MFLFGEKKQDAEKDKADEETEAQADFQVMYESCQHAAFHMHY